MDLYGFSSQEERRLFQLLTSVSGVGPKAALAILSSSTPENLALSIITGDEKALGAGEGLLSVLRSSLNGIDIVSFGSRSSLIYVDSCFGLFVSSFFFLFFSFLFLSF